MRIATAPEPAAEAACDASCGSLGLATRTLAAQTKIDEVCRSNQHSSRGDRQRLKWLTHRPELGQGEQDRSSGEQAETTLAAMLAPVAGSEAQSGRPDRGGQQKRFRRLFKDPAERQAHRSSKQQGRDDAVHSTGHRQHHSGAIDRHADSVKPLARCCHLLSHTSITIPSESTPPDQLSRPRVESSGGQPLYIVAGRGNARTRARS